MAFLPLVDPQVEGLLPHLTSEERNQSWHLVTIIGEDLVGGEGVVAVLEVLRPTRWLGVGMRRLRLVWLMDLIDKGFKTLRGSLGRLVPDVTGPRRYP